MYWFDIGWWKYLLQKRTQYQKNYEIPFWEIVICRIKNHPNGMIWYNPNELEPDGHCKDCGDDLG